jgi:hypothetical protein
MKFSCSFTSCYGVKIMEQLFTTDSLFYSLTKIKTLSSREHNFLHFSLIFSITHTYNNNGNFCIIRS